MVSPPSYTVSRSPGSRPLPVTVALPEINALVLPVTTFTAVPMPMPKYCNATPTPPPAASSRSMVEAVTPTLFSAVTTAPPRMAAVTEVLRIEVATDPATAAMFVPATPTARVVMPVRVSASTSRFRTARLVSGPRTVAASVLPSRLTARPAPTAAVFMLKAAAPAAERIDELSVTLTVTFAVGASAVVSLMTASSRLEMLLPVPEPDSAVSFEKAPWIAVAQIWLLDSVRTDRPPAPGVTIARAISATVALLRTLTEKAPPSAMDPP